MMGLVLRKWRETQGPTHGASHGAALACSAR